MSDKELYEIYMLGFREELEGIVPLDYDDELKQRAYRLGASHAIMGDDNTSLDYLTIDEIIILIRQ